MYEKNYEQTYAAYKYVPSFYSCLSMPAVEVSITSYILKYQFEAARNSINYTQNKRYVVPITIYDLYVEHTFRIRHGLCIKSHTKTISRNSDPGKNKTCKTALALRLPFDAIAQNNHLLYLCDSDILN